jgi:hypothetical protein
MYVPTEQSWPSVDIRRQKSFATYCILQQWSIHTVESGQINRTQNPKPPHFAAQYIFLLLKCRETTPWSLMKIQSPMNGTLSFQQMFFPTPASCQSLMLHS